LKLAPVILFTYNRPDHTLQTLRALKNNVLADQSVLHIYVDGLKEGATKEAKDKQEELKTIIKSEQWCKEVVIHESDKNLGLANSVKKGVTEIVNQHGRVIVLEDDLITGKYFLKFMNDALEMYENSPEVISITGYIYPVKRLMPQTFFLKGADCWGWATWKRGWDLFESDGKKLLSQLEQNNLIDEFNFYKSYPYAQMLRDQIEGKNDSWAILWYASAFLKNKLTLYPGISMVHNIGIDGSGMHSGAFTDKFDVKLNNSEVKLQSVPIKENERSKVYIAEYFYEVFGTKPKTTKEKVVLKIKDILKRKKK